MADAFYTRVDRSSGSNIVRMAQVLAVLCLMEKCHPLHQGQSDPFWKATAWEDASLAMGINLFMCCMLCMFM